VKITLINKTDKVVMPQNELMTLIKQYFDKFNEGPPIFGMEEDEALEKMRNAISTGKEITDTPDKHIPDGAIL